MFILFFNSSSYYSSYTLIPSLDFFSLPWSILFIINEFIVFSPCLFLSYALPFFCCSISSLFLVNSIWKKVPYNKAEISVLAITIISPSHKTCKNVNPTQLPTIIFNANFTSFVSLAPSLFKTLIESIKK